MWDPHGSIDEVVKLKTGELPTFAFTWLQRSPTIPPQHFMPAELKQRIREILAANLMLQMPVEELRDDQPLFGPGGLGLDSVDALQLVVALDKNFGLKISDQSKAREILKNLDSIAAAVAAHESGSSRASY